LPVQFVILSKDWTQLLLRKRKKKSSRKLPVLGYAFGIG
jgi:hypothetical protein